MSGTVMGNRSAGVAVGRVAAGVVVKIVFGRRSRRRPTGETSCRSTTTGQPIRRRIDELPEIDIHSLCRHPMPRCGRPARRATCPSRSATTNGKTSRSGRKSSRALSRNGSSMPTSPAPSRASCSGIRLGLQQLGLGGPGDPAAVCGAVVSRSRDALPRPGDAGSGHRCRGAQPYRLFSVTGDVAQCRIHEFLTHAQLELASELGLLEERGRRVPRGVWLMPLPTRDDPSEATLDV